MKNDRNMGMMPFPNMMGGMPTNMLMFLNYMNDNYNNLDTRVSSLEKKVKVLENRISRLEVPYQNNLNTNMNSNSQTPYQSTHNTGYNGDMYMM